MKVVNMGNIADAFKFDDLPATGIVIEATPEELKLLPNLAYKDVTISEHVGNAAKMRDALLETKSVIEKCMDILNKIPDGCEYDGLIDEVADELCDLRESHVNAALAAPPRNCDVGKPEEQQDRLREFCRRHFDARECGLGRSVAKCPAYQGGKNPDCSLWWAQMPYEEGGANGK